MSTFGKRIIAFVCVAVMAFLEFYVLYMGAHPEMRKLFGAMPNRNLYGIMNMLQILICVIIVILDWKLFSLFGIGELVVAALLTINAVKGREGLNAIPGIFLFSIGIIIVLILRKQYGKREREAFLDSLTGIPNRNHFQREIQYRISKNQPFYYVYMDLSGFKKINDEFGHVYGDYLLKETVRYWTDFLDKEDYLARLGGDEFCLLIPERNVVDIMAYLKPFIEDITTKQVKNEDDNIAFMVGANAGVVRFPKDSSEKEDMLRKADFAMMRAKKDVDSRVCLYNQEVEDEIVSIARIEEMVKKGFEHETFYMVYQPQFDVKHKRLRGFEALVRLKDEEGKVVSPGQFIPFMEQSGDILKMDYYVLRKSMKQFLPIVKDKPELMLSVNISAKHISDERFAGEVENILKEIGFPAQNLEIEITEYSFVYSEELAIATLQKLREMGIMIALDDFGTGYSSLSMIFRIPLDLIKIDKSMIDEIHTDVALKELVGHIIRISETIHCETLSEGIEKQEQADVLEALGCEYIQGYLWGKPLMYEEAKSLAVR